MDAVRLCVGSYSDAVSASAQVTVLKQDRTGWWQGEVSVCV